MYNHCVIPERKFQQSRHFILFSQLLLQDEDLVPTQTRNPILQDGDESGKSSN